MRSRTITVLFGVLLAPALGIGHCQQGDDRVFGEGCIRIYGPSSATRPPAKLVSWEYEASGLQGSIHQRLDVSACSTSLTRVENGVGRALGPLRIESAEAKALHDALVEAGALDATSVPADFFDCGFAISSYVGRSDVTVYEPSLIPGGAWSNSFTFGHCAHTPQTEAIEALLRDWVEAHFTL
jgi:hypothetical protein